MDNHPYWKFRTHPSALDHYEGKCDGYRIVAWKKTGGGYTGWLHNPDGKWMDLPVCLSLYELGKAATEQVELHDF